ncbi:hypothetical protein BKA82DRAFT_333160 [Pisolithus tinctorius]|uniref:Uncharacterized protein n=1 Tax=Pisolithus tinctorius Marx 270 TaxID=870435 RepID=A0A0C3N1W5_PISTI|nr:hypothetical protein BKA82DRAFT_333160 [Pisolithus tinctorius]KIN95069.1 hypothetical protein M404DRAFT_333160 [Pisolithus tinctorius Marx 270]
MLRGCVLHALRGFSFLCFNGNCGVLCCVHMRGSFEYGEKSTKSTSLGNAERLRW